MMSDRPGPLARALQQRGLAAPARLLLEAHRPLRPLLAEAGAFLSPILQPLLGRRYGGLQIYLPQVAPLFAPNVNSFRRMRPSHCGRAGLPVGLAIDELEHSRLKCL